MGMVKTHTSFVKLLITVEAQECVFVKDEMEAGDWEL